MRSNAVSLAAAVALSTTTLPFRSPAPKSTAYRPLAISVTALSVPAPNAPPSMDRVTVTASPVAGVCVVAALFVLFVYSGIQIAMRANDLFGMFLAFGITAAIAAQAVVNMAVVLGLAPTKGFTLPFVSYGGSSLVITMFGVGILQSVHAMRGTPPPVAGGDDVPPPPPDARGLQARAGRSVHVVKKLFSSKGRNRRR